MARCAIGDVACSWIGLKSRYASRENDRVLPVVLQHDNFRYLVGLYGNLL